MNRPLPDNQAICLQALALIPNGGFDDPMGNYAPFLFVMRLTGLPRNEVRRNVRALARKGYAEFHSGLWSEDGRPVGAGYRLTKAGRERVAKIMVQEAAP